MGDPHPPTGAALRRTSRLGTFEDDEPCRVLFLRHRAMFADITGLGTTADSTCMATPTPLRRGDLGNRPPEKIQSQLAVTSLLVLQPPSLSFSFPIMIGSFVILES